MTNTIKMNENGLISYEGTYALFADNLDNILNKNSVDDNNTAAQLFRTNREKVLEAKNCINEMDKRIVRDLISSGRQKSYGEVLGKLKAYYDQGRNAMQSLGIAIRTNDGDGSHIFSLDSMNSGIIDNAIYQEKMHQSEYPDDYPSRTMNIEKPKGDALVVIAEFFEAKDALEQFNQFQMLHHLKNSVCAAHWALERNHVNGFERINKAPKLGLPL